MVVFWVFPCGSVAFLTAAVFCDIQGSSIAVLSDAMKWNSVIRCVFYVEMCLTSHAVLKIEQYEM